MLSMCSCKGKGWNTEFVIVFVHCVCACECVCACVRVSVTVCVCVERKGNALNVCMQRALEGRTQNLWLCVCIVCVHVSECVRVCV